MGIPSGAILNAYLIIDNDNEGLIYFPKKLEWIFDGKNESEIGCGSIGFAIFDYRQNVWIRHGEDYLNLINKQANKYEKLIRK